MTHQGPARPIRWWMACCAGIALGLGCGDDGGGTDGGPDAADGAADVLADDGADTPTDGEDRGVETTDTADVADVADDGHLPPTDTWLRSIGGGEHDFAAAATVSGTGALLVLGKAYISDMVHPDVLPIWLGEVGADGAVGRQTELFFYDDDLPHALIEASDGDVVLVGEASVEEIGEAIYEYDAMVLRLDDTGAEVFRVILGGEGDDRFRAVAEVSGGGLVAAGSMSEHAGGDDDAWIVSLDSGGNVVWQRRIGDWSHEVARVVLPIPGGDLLVAGSTSSAGAGGDDLLVVRLDPDGAIRWQKTIGGPADERAHAGAITGDGGVVLVGWTQSLGAGLTDGLALKLDADGNLIWQKVLGTEGSDVFEAVTAGSGGRLTLAGQIPWADAGYQQDLWVVALDADGSLQWQTAFGHTDYNESSRAVASWGAGYLAVVGSTGANGGDIIAARLDDVGAVTGPCGLASTPAAVAVDGTLGIADAALPTSATFDVRGPATLVTRASALPVTSLCPE